MTRKGKNDSCYYFELLIEEDSQYSDWLMIGVSPKPDDYNTNNCDPKKDSGYYYCSANGEFFSRDRCKTYGEKCPKGTKVGVLLNMYDKSIKFFVNGVD